MENVRCNKAQTDVVMAVLRKYRMDSMGDEANCRRESYNCNHGGFSSVSNACKDSKSDFITVFSRDTQNPLIDHSIGTITDRHDQFDVYTKN